MLTSYRNCSHLGCNLKTDALACSANVKKWLIILSQMNAQTALH